MRGAGSMLHRGFLVTQDARESRKLRWILEPGCKMYLEAADPSEV